MGRIFRLGEGPGRGRVLRSPGARCRHGLALGQLELARRCSGGVFARFPHALRQFGQAGPHLERLVRSARGSSRFAHRQPQRALHPVEGGDGRATAHTPILDSVTLAYLPQNSPPVVKASTSSPRRPPPRRPPSRHRGLVIGRVQRHRYRYARRQHPDFRGHSHPDSAARRRPADHRHLAGRGPR